MKGIFKFMIKFFARRPSFFFYLKLFSYLCALSLTLWKILKETEENSAWDWFDRDGDTARHIYDGNYEIKGLENVIKCPRSTFYEFINDSPNIGNYKLHNDKQTAFEDRHYLKDDKDIDTGRAVNSGNKIIGSIFCCRIEKRDSNALFEAIIVISTYGQYLISDRKDHEETGKPFLKDTPEYNKAYRNYIKEIQNFFEPHLGKYFLDYYLWQLKEDFDNRPLK